MSQHPLRAHPWLAADDPLAVHLRRADQRLRTSPHRCWTETDGPLPALFISHGAPPLLEDAEWMRQLFDWGQALPKPRSILIVSAHWESEAPGITSVTPSELIYDFTGFDERFYRLRYDTPSARTLAKELAAVLPSSTTLYEHRGRGLDHGAWVPLTSMYPQGDIPVLQLSLPIGTPESLVGFGARLAALRHLGVLVVGSGFMTHGLAHLDWSRPGVMPGWSSEFDLWVAQCLADGDLESLLRYDSQAPGLPYAHPTVEHLMPLFVALGAGGWAENRSPEAARTVIDGHMMGLARRSLEVGPRHG